MGGFTWKRASQQIWSPEAQRNFSFGLLFLFFFFLRRRLPKREAMSWEFRSFGWIFFKRKEQGGVEGGMITYCLLKGYDYIHLLHINFSRRIWKATSISWFVGDPISNHWQTCRMGLRHMGEFALSLLQYGAQFLSQHAGELGIVVKTSRNLGQSKSSDEQNNQNHRANWNHLCN